MRKRKSKASDVSSERCNWEKIFNGLVQMLRTQQNQIQSLVNERKFLQDRITMQHERWASDMRLYEDQIADMKGILIFEEKKRLLEAAKAELLLGSKHREASILKWILEHTEDELADLKGWFEYLSRKSSNGEDEGTILVDTDQRKKGIADSKNKSTWTTAEEEISPLKFNNELRRLKQAYEKLSLEKDAEVSALLEVKKSVWNQYNIMEKNYIDKLKSKQTEVEQANEKIEILISRVEQLRSGNGEKDDTISRLERKVASMEADKKRLKEEKSRLAVELEALRRSSNTQVTPILNSCIAKTETSSMGGTKSRRGRRNITSDTPDPETGSGKKIRSSKRKEGPLITVSETPKLLSSNFKIPKLKNAS
ncbi:coiled-coil domain-containing protein 158 isoform X1 [Senna tora]|uniref:Coiled-coil domain-containing protein 158 isoform X1 n=1 Tax=Senna tora TaxID=362788 RepID=A0A834SH06_9FABA|nr:coiled-coil domain-containing protein 158 isoform X1 [Senna tora]